MSAGSTSTEGACAAHALLQQLATEVDGLHYRNKQLVAENAKLEKEICALRAQDVPVTPPSPPKSETANGTEAGRGFELDAPARSGSVPSPLTVPPPYPPKTETATTGVGDCPLLGPGFELQAPARPGSSTSPEQAEAAPLPKPVHACADEKQATEATANPGRIDAPTASAALPASGKAKAHSNTVFRWPSGKIDAQQWFGLHHTEEPKRRTLAAVVESPRFDLGVLTLIFFFIVTIGFEVQYYGIGAGYDMQFEGYDSPKGSKWPNAEPTFRALEAFFVIAFTIELVLRVLASPRRFFLVPLSYVDILCVFTGFLHFFFGAPGILMLARFLRFLKIGRALHYFRRTDKTATTVELLLKCIVTSIPIVSWGMSIVVFLQCVMGIAFNQGVIHVMSDPDVDVEERQAVFAYYGTFTRAMITMFEVHFANWAPACRVLVDNVGEWAAYVFLAYRCVVGFAILSVINAVFVQQSIKVAHHDRDIMLQEAHHEATQYADELKTFFDTLDTSKDGHLSWDEVMAVQDDHLLKLWMGALGIDSRDLKCVFKLFDVDGDMAITPEELLKGASKTKGNAKSIDILHLLSRVSSIDQKLNTLLGADRLLAPVRPLQPVRSQSWV